MSEPATVKSPRQLGTDLVAECQSNGARFMCWDTVDQVVDWLREQEPEAVNPCPFIGEGGFAHTRNWCGYEGCRES